MSVSFATVQAAAAETFPKDPNLAAMAALNAAGRAAGHISNGVRPTEHSLGTLAAAICALGTAYNVDVAAAVQTVMERAPRGSDRSSPICVTPPPSLRPTGSGEAIDDSRRGSGPIHSDSSHCGSPANSRSLGSRSLGSPQEGSLRRGSVGSDTSDTTTTTTAARGIPVLDPPLPPPGGFPAPSHTRPRSPSSTMSSLHAVRVESPEHGHASPQRVEPGPMAEAGFVSILQYLARDGPTMTAAEFADVGALWVVVLEDDSCVELVPGGAKRSVQRSELSAYLRMCRPYCLDGLPNLTPAPEPTGPPPLMLPAGVEAPRALRAANRGEATPLSASFALSPLLPPRREKCFTPLVWTKSATASQHANHMQFGVRPRL